MIRKLSLMIMSVFVGWGLFGCSTFATPTVNFPISPVVIPTLEATFTLGEDFDCWIAPQMEPQAEQNRVEKQEASFLLVTGFPTVELIRYFPNRQQVQTLASGILGYRWNVYSPVSPDGRYVWYAAEVDGYTYLYIYDLENGQTRKLPWMRELYSTGLGVVWSPDGQCLFFGGEQAWVIAYRLSDGAVQQKSFPAGYYLSDFDVSPKGRLWAINCEKGICVHDLASPDLDDIVLPTDGIGNGLPVWSPDGKILVYADSFIKESIPGTKTRIKRVTFDGQSFSIEEVARPNTSFFYLKWSADGQRLLIGGNDHAIEFYDFKQRTFAQLPLSEGISQSFASSFAPSGKQIVFAVRDYEGIFVYDLGDKTFDKLPLPGVKYIDYLEWLP